MAKIKSDIIEILQLAEKDLEYEVFQEMKGKEQRPHFNKNKRGGGKFHQGRGGRGGRGNAGDDFSGGFDRKNMAPPTTGGEDNFYRADKAKVQASAN